ncbi:MAG TPA: tetratricopeptide repeat protein [Candidatus Competibacteraceae bacterium]|nr:tetratricopeptide repeat protein [Candidatus Competibacteraceae bacterium]
MKHILIAVGLFFLVAPGLAFASHEEEYCRQNVKQFRKAAEQGNCIAQANLGSFYKDGCGVPRDEDEAQRWFRQAAAQFRKAAEQGDLEAQFRLAGMYEAGDGVAQDDAAAANWHLKAAEQGNPQSLGVLGRLYEEGKGVARDDVSAYMWYTLSAARGASSTSSVPAKNPLDDLETTHRLTPAQIGEARKRAQAWMSNHPVAKEGYQPYASSLPPCGRIGEE